MGKLSWNSILPIEFLFGGLGYVATEKKDENCPDDLIVEYFYAISHHQKLESTIERKRFLNRTI